MRTGDSREEWPWKKDVEALLSAVPREHSGKDGQRMLDGWVMTQVIWAKDATLGSLVGAQYGGAESRMDFTNCPLA